MSLRNIKPLSLSKKFTIDALKVGRKIDFMHFHMCIPCKDTIQYAITHNISLTACALKAYALALKENPNTYAVHDILGRLVSVKKIDIAVMIEISFENETFPLMHVVRNADSKSATQISHEIRTIKSNPKLSPIIQNRRFFKIFCLIPGFIRRGYLRLLAKCPNRLCREAGIAVISTIFDRNFDGYATPPPTIYNVSLVISSVHEGNLKCTLSANHATISGREFVAFAQSFQKFVRLLAQ